MQQWRERLNMIAAIAGDVGLFGCVLYFIVLKNFAQHVEVRFGGWFTGLCLLYFFNGQLLRKEKNEFYSFTSHIGTCRGGLPCCGFLRQRKQE